MKPIKELHEKARIIWKKIVSKDYVTVAVFQLNVTVRKDQKPKNITKNHQFSA